MCAEQNNSHTHTQTHKHSNNTSPLTAIIPDERTTCVRFVRSSSSSGEDLRLRRASPQHIDTTYICANNKWYVVCVMHGGPDSQRRRHCILLLHSIERRTINSSARLRARFCISVVFLCCIFICCILSLDTRSHPSPHRGVLIDVYIHNVRLPWFGIPMPMPRNRQKCSDLFRNIESLIVFV